MLIKNPADIPSSEITPKEIYVQRRRFMREIAAMTAAGVSTVLLPSAAQAAMKFQHLRKSRFSVTGEKPTSFKDTSS